MIYLRDKRSGHYACYSHSSKMDGGIEIREVCLGLTPDKSKAIKFRTTQQALAFLKMTGKAYAKKQMEVTND